MNSVTSSGDIAGEVVKDMVIKMDAFAYRQKVRGADFRPVSIKSS